MIRNRLAQLTCEGLAAAQAAGALPSFEAPPIQIERPQNPALGDYSTAVALKLASAARRAPAQIAQAIAAHLPSDESLSAVEIAAPGFINFKLSPEWLAHQVQVINRAGAIFGNVELGQGQRVQVEHVSANPTGPLTVGSARNAALGDSLARILKAAGYAVETEYYINDAGSQVRHFGESIYALYAQAAGRAEPFPDDGYKGAYVADIANDIFQREGAKYLEMPRVEAVRVLGRIGIEQMVAEAHATLERMRVAFDSWFSEQSVRDSRLFEQVLKMLREKGLIYESDGAIWFAATKFGLDKDAVLIRSPKIVKEASERPTYLASDVAYVWNKLVERKFDRAIYVWGADHQGDVPRLYAVTEALGLDRKRVKILIYQLVTLMQGGEKVRMSKRAGEFDTLRDLIDEVGADAVRFLLITRSADSAMDFDFELAKQQSEENPVYYVQYAHARIASIMRNAADAGVSGEGADLRLLKHPAELTLIRTMLRLEEVLELAASRLEPHHLPHYALTLAATFHTFYRECRVLSSDPADAELSKARLQLVVATKHVLARALDLMGVAAPEAM